MDEDTSDLAPRRKLDFIIDEEKEDELIDNCSSDGLLIERHSTILEGKIPKIDMEFDNDEAAYEFYNEYARLMGFSIRKNTVHRDAEKNVVDRTFCCSWEGFRLTDKRDVLVKDPRPETRNGCLAMLRIDSKINGKFKIVNFVAAHNGHELASPSKAHILRSHRRIPAAIASQADDLDSSGIAPREGFTLLTKHAGGRENVGFLIEDYKNYLRTKRTREIQKGDTGGVMEYLQQRKLEDPNFVYVIQLDKDDKITNILWVDTQMMVDYSYFGDVVSFDTTYGKNKDGRPFALFVGVNHHKQTIIFGAALLYDETASTFMWLFDSFAETMSGKKPITILTDQDAAMAKALAIKWPDTCHRLCIWHIYQNAAMHLSNVFAKHTNFSKDFTSCVYDYEEEEVFIDAWNEMLRKYGLETNEWLDRLFKIKEKWALVYGRQYLCADLTTTQRSESMNGVLKRYVSYKNNMLQFFQHFDRLVADRRYAEIQADLRSSQTKPKSNLSVEIMKHASTVYTHEISTLFREEVRKAYDAKIELSSETGETSEYKITLLNKHRQHTVMYDSSEVKVSCRCKKFEFVGILCSHALKVLSFKNITRIPELYIMKRWTKKAKKSVVQEESLGVGTEHSIAMDEKEEKKMIGVRFREYCRLSNELGTRATMSTKTFRIVMANLRKTIEEVDAALENGTNLRATLRPFGSKFVVQNNASDKVGNTSDEPIVIKGWKNKEKKTVTSGKRPKNGLEMSIRKKRKKQIDMTMPIDTITNEENNAHNVNSGKSCPSTGAYFNSTPDFSLSQAPQNVNSGNTGPNIGASFNSTPYSSLSHFSQDFQAYRSNTNVTYPLSVAALSQMQPFAQTFTPIVHQPHNVSHYSRVSGQNGMSLTKLLQQQIAGTQEVETLEWNNSTNSCQNEKPNEKHGDIPRE